MAPVEKKASRKNKRKARTEVSSPSSSESDSPPPSPPPAQDPVEDHGASVSSDSHYDEPSDAEPVFTKRIANPEQAFADFYLHQVTQEFADDLDKLRSASDFNARSVDMLVGALKQGTVCFAKEEKMKIGAAASGG